MRPRQYVDTVADTLSEANAEIPGKRVLDM